MLSSIQLLFLSFVKPLHLLLKKLAQRVVCVCVIKYEGEKGQSEE